MDYKVHIVNEKGEGIGGTITFFDSDGLELGKFTVPIEGANAPTDMVEVSTTYQVDSPGYIGYAVLSLSDWNEFTLVKDGSNKTIVLVLIALGILLAGKLIRG